MDQLKESEVLATLESNPGDPIFVSYADYLRVRGRFQESVMVCMAGLSASPGDVRGKLVLAQSFYDAGFMPFAVRELRELAGELPENRSIRRILDKLAPGVSSAETPQSSELSGEQERREEATVAEAEFDFDEIDLLEEDDSK